MSKAVQSALKKYKVEKNQLIVGEIPVSDWVDNYGSPLYLYDMSVIRKKIAFIRDCLPKTIKLEYAVKANPNIDVLKEMVKIVDGFDVASIGEFDRVVKAGGDPKTISFAGPGKRKDELFRAIESDIGSINIESERELDLIVEEG